MRLLRRFAPRNDDKVLPRDDTLILKNTNHENFKAFYFYTSHF
ncbi:hypothetical protein RFEPED_0635 [Rickettsia felis str. Pedreira]|uniref:Uncharacterized protein n=1 Tax=Rickettsia felis str. Pedreira TaxID=1359196 RepID=A0A0F3MRH8_RICFI|nr:hypothetical protein [Rickettsia felis]KJV58256.1 hypothetical protein RFEPED_0635 [Rickettsia felis str. Pedreira]